MATAHKAASNPSSPTSTEVKPVPGDSPLAGTEPVIIDMGKKSRKSVRKLKKGKPGRLMNRVAEAIEHLRENGGMTGDVRPIIIIVRQKGKKNKGRRVAKMWGLG